ncbi:MAG TPA: hypothetical protein PLH94_04970 [Fimbriimonadaceae bacterium]|nr:hypothetical protein [Fimbriimonadaceae bacterium]
MAKLYSEAEVSKIIQRAVELQEAGTDATSYTPGVTTEELQKMAEELGVDPRYLEEAMREQIDGASSQERKGAEEERVVEGEVSPEDFDILLQSMRTVSMKNNPTAQIGRTLQTNAFAGGGMHKVEITSRNGRTRIKAKNFPFVQFMSTLYPAFILSAVGAPQIANAGHPNLAIGLAIGAIGAAWLAFKLWNDRAKKGLVRLADGLAARVQELAKPTTTAESPDAVESGEEVRQQLRLGTDDSE